jgi:hypothetical protein
MKTKNAYKWEARHRTAIRVACFATLVLSVLLAPSVSALTVLPEGGGTTWIYSNGSCLAMVAVPVPQDIHHTDNDNVSIPMRAEWFDNRSFPSSTFENWYVIDAFYRNAHYGNYYQKNTNGGHVNDHAYFYATVPNVRTGTSMTINYSAYVYNPSNGRILCFDEGTTWFSFIN